MVLRAARGFDSYAPARESIRRLMARQQNGDLGKRASLRSQIFVVLRIKARHSILHDVPEGFFGGDDRRTSHRDSLEIRRDGVTSFVIRGCP
jgi:hypothetical protein